MALPAVVAPTLAVTALKEGLVLCQSILEYRVATQKNDLQRERMHTEANLVSQQLDNEHNTQIIQINTIAQAYKITLESYKQLSTDNVQIIAECQQQITCLLNVFSASGVEDKIRQDILSTVNMLSQQQSILNNCHMKNAQAPINAFAMLIDGLRDNGQSRTFTDVN